MRTREPAADPLDYQGALEEQVNDIVAAALKAPESADKGEGGLGRLMDAAFGFMQDMARDLAARQPPPKPLACKEGCAFCCIGTEVHVSAPEVLRIAEHVMTRFSNTARAALLARLRDIAAKKAAHGTGAAVPALFSCPLLRDGRCSVYAVRPFTCRGFNSYDAGVCERRKAGGEDIAIEGYTHQDAVAQATLRGVQRGCAEAGLGGDALDLVPALLIALNEPDAAGRWRRGEDVFGPARARLARD